MALLRQSFFITSLKKMNEPFFFPKPSRQAGILNLKNCQENGGRKKEWRGTVPPAGIEPATQGLETLCSIR